MPKTVLILDSSQISAWFECSEKKYLLYDELLATSLDVNEFLAAGSYGHKMLEIYYKKKDYNFGKAVEEALAFDPGKEFPLPPETIALIRERFNQYWQVYSSRDILVSTIDRKIIDVENGQLVDKVINEPLVEQGFSYPLLDTKEYLFILEGRIDLLGTMSGYRLFTDHKFQFRERHLDLSSIQFKNYALVTGCTVGMVNYIRLHKAITKNTLQREIINFDSRHHREWRQELIEIYIRIATEKRRRNWDACGGKFGYACQYKPLCDMRNHPEMYQIVKNQNYVIRPEWKPW